MVCCLNPDCQNPLNPDEIKFCQECGTPIILLRNRYCPIKPLGSGGFGRTYLAKDIDKLNEHCVIKQLAPKVQGSWAMQKAKELFEQEARQLQKLGEHPQIPGLLAYFEQDNRLYLVQQYIEGETLLKELTQQGDFSEQKIREFLLDLLNILKEVHQNKVIHRDIKPENIIRRGSDKKLVLIDFGVAKQLTATGIAKTGTTIGSFGYVPLEQMESGKAYNSSDLYSLGATCFHLLSGINPRELWNRQGYGWVASWQKHVKQPLNKQLERIIDKMLQEDHQQRYQLATEVLEELNSQPSPSYSKHPKVISPQPTLSISASTMPTKMPNRLVYSQTSQWHFKILFLAILVIFVGLGVLLSYPFWLPWLSQWTQPQPDDPDNTSLTNSESPATTSDSEPLLEKGNVIEIDKAINVYSEKENPNPIGQIQQESILKVTDSKSDASWVKMNICKIAKSSNPELKKVNEVWIKREDITSSALSSNNLENQCDTSNNDNTPSPNQNPDPN